MTFAAHRMPPKTAQMGISARDVRGEMSRADFLLIIVNTRMCLLCVRALSGILGMTEAAGLHTEELHNLYS
jgi:hypothetical protein